MVADRPRASLRGDVQYYLDEHDITAHVRWDGPSVAVVIRSAEDRAHAHRILLQLLPSPADMAFVKIHPPKEKHL